METLKKFELKYQQQEEYRNKIYAFCYDYLDRKSEHALTPETLLNMGEYEIHELAFLEFLYNAGDVIGLPLEIIYLKFPYLEYYECDDEPAPLSITKLADLLIEIMMIYQTQWEKFKALSQHYTQIYSIIEKYLPLHNIVFSSDMIINKGGYSVRNFKAKRMVKRCAFAMGLNQENVYRVVADLDLLKMPIEWSFVFLGIFFVGLGMLIASISFASIMGIQTIFSIMGAIIILFFGLMYFFPSQGKINPMTVKEFADKIIGIRLVERCYQKNKSNETRENK